MTKSSLTERLLTSFICLFLVTVYVAHGEDSQHSIPVPESVCKKMEILFLKYYPKVATTNDQANGIHFEYEVTTYEFPPADPSKKHENPIQRGPKQGGILCSIYLETGKYSGQLLLGPLGAVIDKQKYKQFLMAPYSPKRDAYLWVSLSYPPQTSEDFLKEFRAVLQDYAHDVE